MNPEWPCATCPKRESGFCGVLMGTGSPASEPETQLLWQNFKTIPAGQHLAFRGDDPEFVHVVCDGWAARYYQLIDGRRQILQVVLAGDLVTPSLVFDEPLHFSVQALTDTRIALFRRAEIKARAQSNLELLREVTRSIVLQNRSADEMVAVLGLFSAEERLAYLFLNIIRRSMPSGTGETRYSLPLRQQQIAEIIGLTPVHVSRVLGTLRERGIIDLTGSTLTVIDRVELERIGSTR
jgi:CRP/FNR family transcriptional regulator